MRKKKVTLIAFSILFLVLILTAFFPANPESKLFSWRGDVFYYLVGGEAFMGGEGFRKERRTAFERMQGVNIFREDNNGIFGGKALVTRGELALLMERHDDNLEERIYQAIRSSEEFEGVEPPSEGFDYRAALIMAESGIKRLPREPESMNSPGVPQSSNFDLDEGANLPDGYTAYLDQGIIGKYYLHYTGERIVEDMIFRVDEWFGPF